MANTEFWYEPSKVILLTGAGFTKNFGGFLATEMWALILNQPEILARERLRKCLLGDLGYERVYDTILTSGNYSKDERLAFTTALERAYGQLDEALWLDRTNSHLLTPFLSYFAGSGRERGFIFTLNQDLLLERFFSNSQILLQIPSLDNSKWFNGQLVSQFRDADRVTLPNEATIDHWKQRFWSKSGIQDFVYLKLHGSYGWKSEDKANVMVLGYAKAGSIAREPILRWYLELFETVLATPNRILVVIGYGFKDEHINSVIADSIKNAGLQLHIISPKEPGEFKRSLFPPDGSGIDRTPRAEELWDGLCGYHCASLADLFHSANWHPTSKGESLFRQVGLH